MDLKDKIRSIPDFPKPGILFRDITPMLLDHASFNYALKELLAKFQNKGITKIASAESRGFIFGSVLAYELKAGFVPLRKPGKLPFNTIRKDFKTEYSTDAFEIHADAIEPGDRVLIVDDVIATGGTALAAAQLVEHLGGSVLSFAFVIELAFLKGREKIKEYDSYSLVVYE